MARLQEVVRLFKGQMTNKKNKGKTVESLSYEEVIKRYEELCAR